MQVDWNELRNEVVGRDASISTPYGERLLTYADFTASGRGLIPFERYMQQLLALYANTHTEDDTTGRLTSQRLAAAEAVIRRRLNADENYKLFSVGSGATAAVTRLQQMLGIYLPPATRERLQPAALDSIARPVVFVGPYEHHSNEISWREGLCDVVEVGLDEGGFLSLQDLEAQLSDPRYADRQKIGSFSAASNVSGVKTDVYAVARLLHRHGALAFFDFSASAPYVRIDVRHDDEAYFDGVFFSPHKYLGGPGASGILLIREAVYRRDLPPSVSGGGTVSFVNARSQDYIDDIEEREKAGTPGILQTIRSALAIDLQHEIGVERIEERERDLIGRALQRLSAQPGVDIIADAAPERRLAILSFNIRSGQRYLHPRFVVRLLNDLFGIQSRAGCSCAGPYGHRLLHIDLETSERYRQFIRTGQEGIKPGWVRLNFHYLISDAEFDFLCEAISFVATHGTLFLRDYRFSPRSGSWTHLRAVDEPVALGAAEAFSSEPAGPQAIGEAERSAAQRRYLEQALARAGELERDFSEDQLRETTSDLIPFAYIAAEA